MPTRKPNSSQAVSYTHLYFLPDEYRRLRDNLGEETVKGLEIAARLYGLEPVSYTHLVLVYWRNHKGKAGAR